MIHHTKPNTLKKPLRIFVLLIILSAFVFANILIKNYVNERAYSKKSFDNKTPLKMGFSSFYNQMAKEDKGFTKKKYYYVNIWAEKCKPCIMEMPYLDSLAGKLSTDIQCFLITEEQDEKITSVLEKKEFHFKNLTIKNDMRDFCAGVFNEKTHGSRIFPMHVVFDHQGHIIFCHLGAMIPTDWLLENKFRQLKLL